MTDRSFARHDHGACIADGLASAEARCADEGLRLTPVRRRVLELLLEDHRAQGAYDILDRLSAEGMGSQPPTVYRALEFLTSHGFAHRIERLNAYVACTRGTGHGDTGTHAPVFLICHGCGAVAETSADAARKALTHEAAAAGFALDRVAMEATGLCPSCRGEGAQ